MHSSPIGSTDTFVRWMTTLVLGVVLATAVQVTSPPATAATCPIGAAQWTGSGDGTSWSDGGNWASGSLPGSTDNVCIEPASPAVIVHSGGTTSVLSIATNANASLEVSGGSLTATSTSTASTLGADLLLPASGSVTFSGTFTVEGDVLITGDAGADLFVNGSGEIRGNLVLAGSGGLFTTIQGSGTLDVATDVGSSFTWSGGSIGGIAFTVAGPTTMSTPGLKEISIGSVVTLNGDTSWSAGDLNIGWGAGGVLVNNATMTITYGAKVDKRPSGPGLFINSGTVDIAAGASDVVTVNVPFQNDGVLSLVSVDTLTLDGGGIWSTPVDVPLGTTLDLGSTHTWSGSSNLTGPGSLLTTWNTTFNGSFDFAGDVTSTNGTLTVNAPAPAVASLLLPSNGVMVFNDVVDVSGDVRLVGTQYGDLVLNAAGNTIRGNLVIAGVTVTGNATGILGTGTVDVATNPDKTFTWANGGFSGVAVTVKGATSIEGPGLKGIDSGMVLTLDGNTTWSEGVFQWWGTSQVVNNAQFTISHDALMTDVGGGGTKVFTNAGTVIVNTTGTVTVNVPFQNDGVLSLVSVDTLELLGGGTSSAPLFLPASTTLRLGSSSFTASSDLTGTGILELVGSSSFDGAFGFGGHIEVVSGASVISVPAISIASLSIDGTLSGSLQFDSTFTVLGDVSMQGTRYADLIVNGSGEIKGNLLFDGSSTSFDGTGIQGPGSLLIATDPLKKLMWRDGWFSEVTATVIGETVIDGSGPMGISASASVNFVNNVVWSAGQIDTYSNAEIVNNATFTIDHGALLYDAGGGGTKVFRNSSLGEVLVSATGTATLSTQFENDGLLRILRDSILDVGSYTQSSTGTLEIEVVGTGGPGIDHGQLTPTTATINGTVAIQTAGPFTPPSMTDFVLINASTVSGAFTSASDLVSGFSGHPFFDSLGHTWEVQYPGSDVVLHTANIFPVVTDDAATTLEDNAVVIDVVTGTGPDTDADGNLDPASITIDTPASSGIATPGVGTVTYLPNPDTNGMDSFIYQICDTFGRCDVATVDVTVTAVNDAPSFTAGADEVILEDAGAQTVSGWASAISAGPVDEAGQVLTFTVSNDNTSLFSSQPTIDPASGDLTYTPAGDANGLVTVDVVLSDDGGTADSGVDTSGPFQFTITVTAVNNAPSFSAGSDETVLEDAGAQAVSGWASAISAGPVDEAGQTVSFGVTNNTNPALFATPPAVSPSGTLTYTPADDANGITVITITLTDDGGTLNGGTDTSTPVNFTINITPVNDAPSFVVGLGQTVLEDSGPHVLPGWITGISQGASIDESSQTASFMVDSNTNPGLFAAVPVVDSTGELTYTLTPNAYGVATIGIKAVDDGGTDNGGFDTSALQFFTISVTSVNDAPSFTSGGDVTVETGSAPYSAPWASSISVGPPNETQAASFNVTENSNPALFSTPPSLDSDGTLSFTPAAGAFGTSNITIDLKDDGGTANSGADTSATATFTITIQDTIPPVVTVVVPGDGAMYEAGVDVVVADFSCSDPGGSGVASCVGDLGSGATLDTSVPGVGYTFTVVGTDNVGNVSTVVNTYDVVDTTVPTITLVGADPLIHEAGDVFVDPGAQVTDNVDPTTSITGVSTVDENIPGSYTVTFDYTDAASNAAVPVVRTVNVVDTTPPVVTAPLDIVVEAVSGAGTPATALMIGAFLNGASAIDAVDGDLTNSITTDAPTMFPLGDTVVTFSVTDAATNTGTAQATVTVTPLANAAPSITSPAAVSVDENLNVITTVAASDPDTGDVLTFSLSGGADQSQLTIDAVTGALDFTPGFLPDFENPLDANGDNVYEVDVTVTDPGGLFAIQPMLVTVLDVNEGGAGTVVLVLNDSTGAEITSGATWSYRIGWGAWIPITGSTIDLDPTVTNYRFRVAYGPAGGSISKSQDISVDSTVTFTTVLVSAGLTSSTGADLSGDATFEMRYRWNAPGPVCGADRTVTDRDQDAGHLCRWHFS